MGKSWNWFFEERTEYTVMFLDQFSLINWLLSGWPGIDYYLEAMENHGLRGHLPQPDNFTTCGKLNIEVNQYNCPIEVTKI